MKRTPLVIVAGAALTALFFVAPLEHRIAAQGAAATPELLQVIEVELVPGAGAEWAALQKEVIAGQKKGGLVARDAWANGNGGTGGNPNTRAIVTPVTLAQFDNPPALVKGLGQEAAGALNARLAKLTARSHSSILRVRSDLGFGTRPAAFKIGILSTVRVASGRNAEFEAALKSDVGPALKKAGITYYFVGQTLYGGDTSQYTSLVPLSDYAELAKGHPLDIGLGPDGFAKLAQRLSSSVVQVERRVVRYLPDLSYGPVRTTSN